MLSTMDTAHFKSDANLDKARGFFQDSTEQMGAFTEGLFDLKKEHNAGKVMQALKNSTDMSASDVAEMQAGQALPERTRKLLDDMHGNIIAKESAQADYEFKTELQKQKDLEAGLRLDKTISSKKSIEKEGRLSKEKIATGKAIEQNRHNLKTEGLTERGQNIDSQYKKESIDIKRKQAQTLKEHYQKMGRIAEKNATTNRQKAGAKALKGVSSPEQGKAVEQAILMGDELANLKSKLNMTDTQARRERAAKEVRALSIKYNQFIIANGIDKIIKRADTEVNTGMKAKNNYVNMAKSWGADALNAADANSRIPGTTHEETITSVKVIKNKDGSVTNITNSIKNLKNSFAKISEDGQLTDDVRRKLNTMNKMSLLIDKKVVGWREKEAKIMKRIQEMEDKLEKDSTRKREKKR